ncbi:hypothetical protein [Actinomadura bangladeshensis]|uniref:Uncharacterized protein n=1 Tax=Actinomadura bangladeshensis TaxID=453573 RepID=A0A4R4NJD2_9ACTN|nr:hypothetical protein [Actinomadura bangladeshensis]TDC09431.1 hypothetical protein E1284_29555 [Actinomadura bangladeshensis]
MALEITETKMAATTNGKVIATATRTGNAWHATTWPTPLDRNGAITALPLAELTHTHGENAPCVIDLREELTRG